jgi:hypothetical protein
MSDFGDSEPEDGYDADDSPSERLGNVIRRIVLLRRSLGAIATQREQLRLAQIEEDLRTILNDVGSVSCARSTNPNGGR